MAKQTGRGRARQPQGTAKTQCQVAAVMQSWPSGRGNEILEVARPTTQSWDIWLKATESSGKAFQRTVM